MYITMKTSLKAILFFIITNLRHKTIPITIYILIDIRMKHIVVNLEFLVQNNT